MAALLNEYRNGKSPYSDWRIIAEILPERVEIAFHRIREARKRELYRLKNLYYK